MAATRTDTTGIFVIDDGGLPAWVTGWCQTTGRVLRQISMPDSTGSDLVATADRVSTIADLVTAAIHTGRPVLVTRSLPAVARGPQVVAALRDLPDDAEVLALAAETATQIGATLIAAHAVPASFGERSIGLNSALGRGHRLLDAVRAGLNADVTIERQLLRLYPHELVGEGLDADLLVIGGPRPRHGLGLVARSALHHAPCSVLLVPRPAITTPGSAQ